MFKYFFFILIGAVVLAISCSKEPAATGAKPLVAVSIPPQKYFAQKIAGGLFDVLVMVPAGASPHTFEPKPSQMTGLSMAKCYFAAGLEFENAWLERLSKTYPGLTIVNTDSGIEKIPMSEPVETGKKTGHEHEGLDPHVWLSPRLAALQAHTIAGALSRLHPAHAALFARNDSLFALECAALHDSIRSIIGTTAREKPFLVFHPSWGYFAREFGLTQIAIEVEGKEPSPSELGAVLDIARKNGITTIFVQPQFSRRSAQIIATEIGATVHIADPLAENWRQNLIACGRAFAGGAP